MKVGLIGFSGSGKSSLYRASVDTSGKGDVAAVSVPDSRFDKIVQQVSPKKITPASVVFHDNIGSIIGGTGKLFDVRTLENAKKMDLLLHVVRAFDNPAAPYYDTVDPVRDSNKILEELILLDLQIMENRVEKLKKSPKPIRPGSTEYTELTLFEKLIPILSDGTPIRKIYEKGDIDENEELVLRNYQLLSFKPLIVVFNVAESNINSTDDNLKKHMEYLSSLGVVSFTLSASIEEEISELDEEDRGEFLASLGIKEPAKKKVIQYIYDTLGLITFYTAGEKETRAWPLKRGSSALKAADTIHSDIARGFIRAEVIHYADWEDAGSWDAAVKGNKMKLEGKEYSVTDGDLINIRCKV